MEGGVNLNIQEFTKIYTKNFIKAKNSSLTRKAYQKLLDIGQAQGIRLNRNFFLKLCNEYITKPEEYDNLNEDEITKKILVQMQGYINRFDGMKKEQERKKERDRTYELE